MRRNLISVGDLLRAMTMLMAVAFAAAGCAAQVLPSPSPNPSPSPSPKAVTRPSLERRFFINILNDQRAIWTAPLHLSRDDARYLVPIGLGTAALIATDRRTAGEVDNGGSLRPFSRRVSHLGTAYATGGVAAAFYLVGRAGGDERARETGLLSAEALINSGILVTALKTATQRSRPLFDNGKGEFFEKGNSFPSGHAISAWSVATVIACEYGERRPLVRFGAYGLATAVSLSRFSGRNHFLSDVLIGSALGYGIGRFVYRKRHDFSLDSDNPTVRKMRGCRLF